VGAAWSRAGVQEAVGRIALGELPECIVAHDRSTHAAAPAELVAAVCPNHAVIRELQRWITEPPVSPCRGRS
jgi:hypothetical protein